MYHVLSSDRAVLLRTSATSGTSGTTAAPTSGAAFRHCAVSERVGQKISRLSRLLRERHRLETARDKARRLLALQTFADHVTEVLRQRMFDVGCPPPQAPPEPLSPSPCGHRKLPHDKVDDGVEDFCDVLRRQVSSWACLQRRGQRSTRWSRVDADSLQNDVGFACTMDRKHEFLVTKCVRLIRKIVVTGIKRYARQARPPTVISCHGDGTHGDDDALWRLLRSVRDYNSMVVSHPHSHHQHPHQTGTSLFSDHSDVSLTDIMTLLAVERSKHLSGVTLRLFTCQPRFAAIVHNGRVWSHCEQPQPLPRAAATPATTATSKPSSDTSDYQSDSSGETPSSAAASDPLTSLTCSTLNRVETTKIIAIVKRENDFATKFLEVILKNYLIYIYIYIYCVYLIDVV